MSNQRRVRCAATTHVDTTHGSSTCKIDLNASSLMSNAGVGTSFVIDIAFAVAATPAARQSIDPVAKVSESAAAAAAAMWPPPGPPKASRVSEEVRRSISGGSANSAATAAAAAAAAGKPLVPPPAASVAAGASEDAAGTVPRGGPPPHDRAADGRQRLLAVVCLDRPSLREAAGRALVYSGFEVAHVPAPQFAPPPPKPTASASGSGSATPSSGRLAPSTPASPAVFFVSASAAVPWSPVSPFAGSNDASGAQQRDARRARRFLPHAAAAFLTALEAAADRVRAKGLRCALVIECQILLALRREVCDPRRARAPVLLSNAVRHRPSQLASEMGTHHHTRMLDVPQHVFVFLFYGIRLPAGAEASLRHSGCGRGPPL